jgi:excisionase family DNA binding protein
MGEFLTTQDVARRLNKSRETILYYERVGKLKPTRTAGGMRLFRRDEVEALAARQEKVASAAVRTAIEVGR